MRNFRTTVGLTIWTLLLIPVSPTWGRLVVIPLAWANQEGGSDTSSLFEGSTVIQVAYGNSLLAGLTPGQRISGIQFRASGNQSQPLPLTNYSFSKFDISLSTSPKLPGSLSTTNFSSNHGLDIIQVRSGPLTAAAGSFPAGPGPGPEPFGPLIPFSNPFTFQGGTLLLEVRTLGDSAPFLTDFSENLGLTIGQRLVGFSYGANGGVNLADCVDIVQFQVSDLADLNSDGSVDAADAGLMFSLWGTTGTGIHADLNADRIVDAADAGQLFAAWTGDTQPTFATPEIGTMSWMIVATLAMVGRRSPLRKRRSDHSAVGTLCQS